MNTKEVRKFKRKLFFFLALINLIIIICTYNIMPVIFNYPPYAESNLEFQNDIEPLNHVQQYIVVFIILTVIFMFITNILMRNIYHFMNKYYRKKEFSNEELKKIRKDFYYLAKYDLDKMKRDEKIALFKKKFKLNLEKINSENNYKIPKKNI